MLCQFPVRQSRRRLLTGLLVLGSLSLLTAPAKGYLQSEGMKERFETVTDDGVTLVGDWYPSTKGKNASVIILVHAIGPKKEGAKRQDWEKLPEALQKAGYAVLAFDFRGYGDSTSVDVQKYWQLTPGRLPKGLVGGKLPSKISSKMWTNWQDLLWLGNDLIAAKKWLNLKNNAMECNSNNICVIGAEQGAVIAQLWLANEHIDPQRDKANDWSKPIPIQFRNPSKFEGEDVARVIWLSMPNSLGTKNLERSLREKIEGLREKRLVYTFAIHGKDDKATDDFWGRALKWIRPEREAKELEGSGVIPIKNVKLAGTALLSNPDLGVQKYILDYLDKWMPKGKAWQKQKEEERPTLFAIQLLRIQ